jgi:acyl-coenzyme A synthetase/AMP-(fatty) acid ligase
VNPLNKLWSLAESQPDSLALASTAVQMNYRDLADNVARFAGALRAAGVRKGDVVAIQLQPELEAVLILATTQLGAVSLSASKLLLDSYSKDIDFLITGDATQLSKVKARIVIDQDFMLRLGAVAKITTPEPLVAEDLVRLSFSSGTTGIPKGIPFTAGKLPIRTESAHRNWMQVTPGMSLLGLDTITGIIALFWAITFGSTYFVTKSARENLELIQKHEIRAIETSPARLKDLLDVAHDSETPNMKQILVAGSLMTESLAEDCKRIFGFTPSYLYGSTEVGSASIGLFDTDAKNRLGKLVSDVDLQIVDDNLNTLPSGELGNIRYRKIGMPTDYWKSPSSKLNGFFEDWFYPGDEGWLSDDGYLYLSGRNDDVVNAAGNKFNLLTLDLWLADTKLFDEVASFSYSDSGETKVGLAFVSKSPAEPNLLIEKLHGFLPNLQLGEILRISSLPRNKMDKVDRRALAELAEESNA